MSTRRKFIRNTGLGVAGMALTPWDNITGQINIKKDKNGSKGPDLTTAANSSLLAEWGFLNVLSFGADPTGVNDSTTAVQNAISAGYDQEMGVLFPLGTYLISDTLYCEKFWPNTSFPRKCHILVGQENNGQRPLIKLASSAPAFDNVSNPKAMIVYVNYLTDGTWTREQCRAFDPITMKQGTSVVAGEPVNSTANIFDEVLRGIDFDCSGHAGAVGLFYSAGQKSILQNVKVKATGSHTGIWGVPGRNSGAVNIEVEGGGIGLHITASTAGTTIVGLKLSGQTGQAIKVNDFCPACIVGFEIKMNKVPFIITTQSSNQTANGTLVLVDGTMESTVDGTLINNSLGKSFYARNVYVKGTGSFINSGSQAVIGGTGTWFRINEYAYTDQANAAHTPSLVNDKVFNTFSIIDGVKNQQNPAQPAVNISNDVTAPSDLISLHNFPDPPQLTFGDSSGTINISKEPYSAVAGGPDCWAAIQAAIDDAETSGKIVLIPKGKFYISKTLILRPKTKLIGLGCKRNGSVLLSGIFAHSSFINVTGSDSLLATVDDPDAETYVYGINLLTNSNVTRHIHWKAGMKSTMMGLSFHGGTVVETTVYFSGNGGGRHYLLEPQTSVYNSTHRHIRTINTMQPLQWYGCNLEAQVPSGANAELVNSKNIRIYGIKREGKVPTIIVDSCTNVAVYGQGSMREGISDLSLGGYVQVRGTTNNIIIPLILVQSNYIAPGSLSTFEESITGQPSATVLYPDGVSLYKRGTIDESVMFTQAPNGINESSIRTAPALKVYPNPVKDIVVVEIDRAQINQKKILITDFNGRQVAEKAIRDLKTGKIDLNISGLKNGIYIVSCRDDNDRMISYGKMVIRK